MHSKKILLSGIFAAFMIVNMGMLQARDIITLQSGWKFAKGNIDGASQLKFDDSKWQTVSVPHDWAISEPTIVDGDSNTGKLPWKGEGWYRRSLDIPAGYAGKTVYLIFDGIMSQPEIFVNGQLAANGITGTTHSIWMLQSSSRRGAKTSWPFMLIHVVTTAVGTPEQESTGKYR